MTVLADLPRALAEIDAHVVTLASLLSMRAVPRIASKIRTPGSNPGQCPFQAPWWCKRLERASLDFVGHAAARIRHPKARRIPPAASSTSSFAPITSYLPQWSETPTRSLLSGVSREVQQHRLQLALINAACPQHWLRMNQDLDAFAYVF